MSILFDVLFDILFKKGRDYDYLTLAAYNSMVDIGDYPYEKVLLGDI